MTGAFTSDAKARWAAEWLPWPGYSKFWAQVVRHMMRKGDAKGAAVEIVERGGRAKLTLDAADPAGRYLNDVETEMTLIDPQLGTRKLPLVQTAPGRYVVEFDTPKAGAYHVELTQKKNGQELSRQSRGLTVGYSDELRLRPTNEELLRQMAEVSGGKAGVTPAEVFAPDDRRARRPTPLWSWLVWAAAGLLVLDVALRRIDLQNAWRRGRGMGAGTTDRGRPAFHGNGAAGTKPAVAPERVKT
jgi:hypothetical protein